MQIFAAGCLAGLSFLLAHGPAQQPVDWPHFRGPNRDGTTTDGNWSPIGREQPLWSANVGRGYSCTPVVDGNLVTAGFDEAAGIDRIVCLDALTGAPRWQFSFAAVDTPMYHEGGTLTTPTIHDGKVYCLNRKGRFHVLALADGAEQWSRDYAEELGPGEAFHGFSASPVIVGERMVLQLCGRIVVAQCADGEVIWQSKDYGGHSNSNPALVEIGGKKAIVALVNMQLMVFATDDGTVLHEYAWDMRGSAMHCAMPIVMGNRVFLSTAYGKGCALLRLGAARAPELLWAHRRMRNKVTACVPHGGHLYGFDESMLRCADLEGNVSWRVRGLGLGSLSIAGDRLLVLSSDGELIVAQARADEWRELSRRKVLDGGVYWTQPVLVGGLIYVRNSRGDLVCLDHRKGAASPDAAEAPVARPAPAAEELFARHAQAVGADALQRDEALRLRGTWTVLLRGVDQGAMTLTLPNSNRWQLSLDEGGLLYACDGKLGWAMEPQGPRLLAGEELTEARDLFGRAGLFAPAMPEGAATEPRAVRFAERDCWRVLSPIAGEGVDAPTRQRSHYFDTTTGHLVGSDGDGLSTIVLRGEQRLAGVTLPRSVTRFRLEDGQEHVLALSSAEWVPSTPDLITRPEGIQRLMRSPEELAAADRELRQRFAAALGRYRLQGEGPVDMLELSVHDGELWLVDRSEQSSVKVADERGGRHVLARWPVSFLIEYAADGKAIALAMRVPGPDGKPIEERFERIAKQR